MGILSVTIEKQSAWDFVTFGSGGFSLGFFAAEGGLVTLKNPHTRKNENFNYGGVGAGLSAGLKIPKIGKVQINTKRGPLKGAAGPTAFPSTGILYLTDNVRIGADLIASDFRGPCAFIEVGGAVVGGGSAYAMYFGLDPARLLPLIPMALLTAVPIPPVAIQFFLNSGKGILLMAGLNVGLQAQIGGAVYIGYLN